MFVKIAKAGQPVIEAVAEVGDTVAQILESEDVEAEGRSITVNGNAATLDTRVNENTGGAPTLIFISQAVKGGADWLIKVSYTGGATVETLATPGMTVKQAVESAEYSVNGRAITVDGRAMDANSALPLGSRLIMLTQAVKGGF